jgi:hypothetical protein
MVDRRSRRRPKTQLRVQTIALIIKATLSCTFPLSRSIGRGSRFGFWGVGGGGGGGRSSILRFVGCGRKRRSFEAARTKERPLIATASKEQGKAEGDAMPCDDLRPTAATTTIASRGKGKPEGDFSQWIFDGNRQ